MNNWRKTRDRATGTGEEAAGDHEQRLREDPEYEWNYKGNPWKPASSGFRGILKVQTAASVALFAAAWAIFQWNHPSVAAGQAFVRTALSEQWQFDAIYAWYETRFGEVPSFIPPLERSSPQTENVQAGFGRSYMLPVSGRIVEPFGGVRSGAGVVIRTTGRAVSAMDTGIVLFSGEADRSGITVVVRHPDGVESVYGYLTEATVKKDDWVEAGETIGILRPLDAAGEGGLVYFAVRIGNSFIDPSDVLAL